MFALLKDRKHRKNIAARLHHSIINQARRPEFYAEYGVPDTIDGRFDVLCLHIFLVINRLYDEGEEGKKLAQALFDCMFREMDAVLREMGVGDLSVPKHIKRMMKGFNGRAIAYREAIASDNPYDLVDVLIRNIYGTVKRPSGDKARKLAAYMSESAVFLKEQPREATVRGEVEFMAIGYDESEQETDHFTRMVA